jgi:2-amino-4-hydroxy-6-hydroxymethyldihydropteridine diphosphokinase
MTLCYLGLGSNLRHPKRNINQAICTIQKLPRSSLLHKSKLYCSQPYGVQAQPNFYNMVVALKTALSPKQLLMQCQLIEKNHGRLRKKHWGPRTLDIDILLYGGLALASPLLTIPHPDMLRRDFVLIPLLEIAPTVQLPNGDPIVYHLKDCETHVHPLD